jgi:hypothetical protein
MKYAIEIDRVATICIPSFVKIGSGIQKFMRGVDRRQDSMVIS